MTLLQQQTVYRDIKTMNVQPQAPHQQTVAQSLISEPLKKKLRIC